MKEFELQSHLVLLREGICNGATGPLGFLIDTLVNWIEWIRFSNDYTCSDLFVPEERAMRRDDPRDRREDGPLYRFTSNQLYSVGFGGVGLGIARGMIDAYLTLPATKVARGASKPMRENNVVQSQFAQCEARWLSARLMLHNAADEAWDNIEQYGEMTQEQRARIRPGPVLAIDVGIAKNARHAGRTRCVDDVRRIGRFAWHRDDRYIGE